jgi:hypothetical protein
MYQLGTKLFAVVTLWMICVLGMEVSVRTFRPMPPLLMKSDIGWNAAGSPYRSSPNADRNFVNHTGREVNQLALRGRPFVTTSADQIKVLLVIGQSIAQAQNRERAQRAPAGNQRRHHGRAVAVIDHKLRVLGALREGPQQCVRHLWEQHRIATADHARHWMLAIRIELVSLAQFLQVAGDPLIACRYRYIPDRAILVAQIYHAQIRQPWHSELCHLAHRRRRVQGGGKHSPCLHQEVYRGAGTGLSIDADCSSADHTDRAQTPSCGSPNSAVQTVCCAVFQAELPPSSPARLPVEPGKT